MAVPSWRGWAELENDPAIFSTILREWGVPGLQVNEVVPLDSIFALPPESVYGLIFLSRWAAAETENDTTEAPSGIWFANQTSSFSCASLALMNIINNHEHLSLGKQLNDFRAATSDLSPKDRGLALDQFDHVRDVHNSFATELDQMNVDSRLKEDALEAARKQRRIEQEKKRKGKKRRKRASFDREDDEPGFHFIAYVPAGGKIWRMDGMEAFPRCIDRLEKGDSWLLKTINELQEQWSSAEANQMEFSLLSLTPRSGEASTEEAEKMRRTREHWGPFIAQMVQLHAQRGDLKSMLL